MKKVWKVLLGIFGGLLAILGLGAKASGKKKEEIKKLDNAIKQKDKEVKQTEKKVKQLESKKKANKKQMLFFKHCVLTADS